VRIEATVATLAPELKIIAPVRGWQMGREEEVAYAREHGIQLKGGTEAPPYSIDDNLWGRAIEAGVLEDPWEEPPSEVYEWTTDPTRSPDEPAYLEISFKEGVPVCLNGQPVPAVDLVERLNELGGRHGVGRIDHLENRLVGIKSREIYEAPAAVLLLQAHQALEDITLPKEVARFKEVVAQHWAQLVYDGLWFSPLREALHAFVNHTQRHVSGDVRLKLFKGHAQVVGRKAPDQLYRMDLATYGRGDQFDQSAAAGFIKLFGMGVRTAAEVQGQLSSLDLEKLLPPDLKRLTS